MKVFLTGGTGFIGGHLVAGLVRRGYEVTCLVRDPSKAGRLRELEAKFALGDVTERESMRQPMQGADVVFHVAAWYSIGIRDPKRMWEINVEGTRHTLELAAELGVPRIIYTSTVGVFGNTRGRLVDETYHHDGRAFNSQYDRTKWTAHYEVAEPLLRQGAPITIVMPGGVYGPGDHSGLGQLMRLYLQKRLPPVFTGSDGLITWAHVEDIAAGHILAAEKGRIGEAYVLAGPPMTYRRALEMWERIKGIPAPRIWLPGWVNNILAVPVSWLEPFFQLPLLSAEALRSSNTTYLASAEKATRELGFRVRPTEEGFRETLEWELAYLHKSRATR